MIPIEDQEKVELWRQRYFEAQAAAEEFVLGKHGQDGLDQWIAINAKITARLLNAQRSEQQSRMDHFMGRLLRQLQLYDSQVTLTEVDGAQVLDNAECGILRYRKAAAKKGVNLTFESPCHYCQSLNKEIVKEFVDEAGSVSCRLTDAGCRWSATSE